MRIPLSTDFKSRTGNPDRDARLRNCYVESKGPLNDPNNPPQTAVRKRPVAQGGIAVGTGTAQGGIGISIGGALYLIGFWGDTIIPYGPVGIAPYRMLSTGMASFWGSWASGVSYYTGDSVTVGGIPYYATAPNVNINPLSIGAPWSTTPVTLPASSHIYGLSIGTGSWTGNTPFYCPFPGGCLISYLLYRNITAAEAAGLGVGTPPFPGWTWDGSAVGYSGYGNYPNPPQGFWHS